jgi:hypothetical protein
MRVKTVVHLPCQGEQHAHEVRAFMATDAANVWLVDELLGRCLECATRAGDPFLVLASNQVTPAEEALVLKAEAMATADELVARLKQCGADHQVSSYAQLIVRELGRAA